MTKNKSSPLTEGYASNIHKRTSLKNCHKVNLNTVIDSVVLEIFTKNAGFEDKILIKIKVNFSHCFCHKLNSTIVHFCSSVKASTEAISTGIPRYLHFQRQQTVVKTELKENRVGKYIFLTSFVFFQAFLISSWTKAKETYSAMARCLEWINTAQVFRAG